MFARQIILGTGSRLHLLEQLQRSSYNLAVQSQGLLLLQDFTKEGEKITIFGCKLT